MNNSTHENDKWIEQVTSQLRQSEDSVDYVIESKLAAARARAIAETPASPFRQRLNLAATAIAGLAVCYIAVRFFQPGLGLNETPSQQTAANLTFEESIDLPILSSTEDLEFFDSLDFIEWMDKQDSTNG